MAETQLQEAAVEAEAGPQVMDLDLTNLTSVMGWELLLKITRQMDTAGRGNWRLVSKAARQAVYESTTALSPWGDGTDTTAAFLPQLLAKCSGLKQLSCKNLHNISGILQLPLGLEALDISFTDVRDLSYIAQHTSLRRLTAREVPGCVRPAARQLAAVLQQLPGLTALDLQDNQLGADAARDVAAVLATLTGLQELGLGETGQHAAAPLLPAVPHLKGLRILDLTFNDLGGQALLPAILQLTRLQRLHLSGNALQAAGPAILAPALRKLQQLEALDLSCNQMHDEGLQSSSSRG